MPANSPKGFYRLSKTGPKDPRLSKDHDQDGYKTKTELDFRTNPLKAYAHECAQLAVDTRVQGIEPHKGLRIFTQQDHANSNYIRNPDCWISDIPAITCISPWNNHNSNRRAGTLISPRHILFAAHYPIRNGSKLRFITKDNNVIERTLLRKKTHPEYKGRIGRFQHDIVIGLLDSDVPDSISYAKVLPDNWKNYLGNRRRLPTFCLDQEEKALITDVIGEFNWSSVYHLKPTDAQRLKYDEEKIIGDSGNPAFLIISSELLLLNVWTYPSSGSSVFSEKATINQMMTDLGGGYQLTEFNFSGFAPAEVSTRALAATPSATALLKSHSTILKEKPLIDSK